MHMLYTTATAGQIWTLRYQFGRHISTRNLAIAEEPREALCQLGGLKFGDFR